MKAKNSVKKSAFQLMPDDAMARQILHDRAKQLAKLPEVQQNRNEINIIRFCPCHNEFYGIPYMYLQEVIDHAVLTKVPHAPDCVAGVINYRGVLLTVMDLAKFFQIKSTAESNHFSILVIRQRDILIGLLAETIAGIAQYDKEKADEADSFQGIVNQKYILGLYQGDTTILNMETIISDLTLQAG